MLNANANNTNVRFRDPQLYKTIVKCGLISGWAGERVWVCAIVTVHFYSYSRYIYSTRSIIKGVRVRVRVREANSTWKSWIKSVSKFSMVSPMAAALLFDLV